MHHSLALSPDLRVLTLVARAPCREAKWSCGTASERLLRLLCPRLFDHTRYTLERRLGRGRFANVYLARGPGGPVAVKKVDAPDSAHDYCSVVDLFAEASALERLKGHSCIVPVRAAAARPPARSRVCVCVRLPQLLSQLRALVPELRVAACVVSCARA